MNAIYVPGYTLEDQRAGRPMTIAQALDIAELADAGEVGRADRGREPQVYRGAAVLNGRATDSRTKKPAGRRALRENNA